MDKQTLHYCHVYSHVHTSAVLLLLLVCFAEVSMFFHWSHTVLVAGYIRVLSPTPTDHEPVWYQVLPLTKAELEPREQIPCE